MFKDVFNYLKNGFKELFSKKNLEKYFVYGIFVLPLVLLFVGFFCIPSNAYSDDDDGNLVSDNLQPIYDRNVSSICGVTCSIVNQKLSLNGTSTSGSWQNLSANSFTLSSGTYTIQWFTNYTHNNIGFGLYNNSDGLNYLYQLNTNRYKTFTLSQDTNFTVVVWWQSSGIVLDNIYVYSMVYEGNYKNYSSFEPYGAIYYSSSNYNNSYASGYDDGRKVILSSLETFNILEFYYNNSILFMSTDNGNSYSSVSGQDYVISYDSTLKCLNVVKDSGAPWNANAIYYLDISFTNPVYVLNMRVPSNKSPSLQKTVVGDVNYSITYGYYDDNPYFMSKDMFTNLTTDLKIYFSVPGGYISGARDFNIYLDGFVFGAAAYDNGYENGVHSLDEIMENYQTNINVLKEEIENLQYAMDHQLGWRSFFFTMADVPFYTASSFLNYEIFGINLFHVLLGFITLLLIFAIIRRFFR